MYDNTFSTRDITEMSWIEKNELFDILAINTI